MAGWRKSYSTLFMGVLLVLTLGWLSTLPMTAQYTDLIAERAYYADVDGKDDIASVQAHSFTVYEGPLFHGNDLRPLWLRLTLAPSDLKDWVLMFQPNYVHFAEVWMPDGSGQWHRAETGSKLRYSQREVKTLVPSVRITPDANHRITVYVRVITPTTPLHVRVLTRDSSAEFDALMSLVAGGFVGIGLMMAMLSTLVYVNTRDTLWGLDALFNFIGVAVLSLQLGLVSRLMLPDSLNVVNQLLLYANVGYVFMTTVLHRALFGLFAIPRWMYWPNTLILLAFPFLVSLIFLGDGDKAMALNNLLLFVSSFWGMLIAFKASHSDRFILGIFRTAYLGLVMYFIWWSIPVVLQLQTGNLTTLYPSLPASLFSMFLLLLILLRNTQLKARDAQRLAIAKRDAERDLQESRRLHEETNSFLGMVLHEVKNPLSTIRLIVGNLESTLPDQDSTVQKRLKRVHALVEDIDDVLERGVEIDSLEQGALVVEKSLMNVAALVNEFRSGHAAAERIDLELPESLLASVDSHLFSLMLRNLVDNAVKYAPETSPIKISLMAQADHYCLAVRSLVGVIGFPDSERVFGKYYRAPLAMRRSGLGLGLYWVRGAARLQGGDALYTREHDWVVFTLCLPN